MTKKQWTKEDEIALINSLQDKYVDQLIELMNSTKAEDAAMKQVNLTSPTGTGKTKMMAKLINKYPEAFFMVTTLSKGQLHKQVETSLSKDCLYDNYVVFGAMSLKINSILTEQNIIDLLPADKDIYWIRDEGHINTNKWSKVLETRCKKIINFSATNKIGYGIVCNFTETMMLRTVHQEAGGIDVALKKLIEIKKAHKDIKKYNPCAIFRVITQDAEKEINALCKKYKLKTISLVDNNNYVMTDICADDNKYDVIINKQKVVEGIDIKRAHVLWMENKPKNPATIVQTVGRCRRNALLWRDDIDVLSTKMRKLLHQTRQCFVFYSISDTQLDTKDGEFIIDLCPIISIEKLHPGHTIYVENGVLPNGLSVVELENQTGYFAIEIDEVTGCNIVNNPNFYETQYGLYQHFFPAFCDLVDNLLNKHSKYFQNLVASIRPYIEGQPLYQYSITHIDTQEDSGFKTFRIISLGGITAEGTIDFQEHILAEVSKYSTHVIGDASYRERQQLLGAKGAAEYLLWKANGETVNLDTSYYQKPVESICLIDRYGAKHTISLTTLFSLVTRILNDEKIDSAAIRKEIIRSHENIKYTPEALEGSIYSCPLTAILGVEDFAQHKQGKLVVWSPTISVTSKIASNTKLTKYIEQQYAVQLQTVQTDMFSGHNDFNFTNRGNSCLGYCVEYYAKYLLFGKDYLKDEIEDVKLEVKEINTNVHWLIDKDINNLIVVRACMLKYRKMMKLCWGDISEAHIMSMSAKTLSNKESLAFINKVVELGIKASAFIKDKIDLSVAKDMCCDFITKHLIGTADFMDTNTIIDLKCTNHINTTMIKQVLAYHLLSQFRPDLDIKKVIIYDAVSERFIEIDLTDIKE